MQLSDFLEKVTPSMYEVLKQSLELGKWPNGCNMTLNERNASMQAIIVYEHHNLPEQQRTGYVSQRCVSNLIKKS